jgi:aspartyl-tRNA synthetase
MVTPPFRSHMVGELGQVELGTKVRLAGWIAFRRLHKRVAFIGLRDGSGIIQVVCAPHEISGVSRESCVSVSGVVRARPTPDDKHPDVSQVEVADGRVEVLAPAATLPFAIEGSEADGEARARWRYLDMRRREARRHLLLRAQLPSLLRRSVQQKGFVELETPYLAHPSSGGAKEFQVTSTRFSARRYVLPQSSQIYRTLLMVGGFERCYQISRNFRDEWMRGRRQPEFSVLDLEAAFATRDDIMGWIETAVAEAVHALLDRQVPVPFRRIPFGQEPHRAGRLRPSLDFAWIVDHPLFVRREGRLDTFHQPFDAPVDGWEDRLEDTPLEVPSTYFTLVSDGRELGGGSLRIHRPDLLRRVLELVGQADTNTAVVEALRYGAPPHGGFTLALDGFAALLLGERSIRSVIPFPKSSGGRCPVHSSEQG